MSAVDCRHPEVVFEALNAPAVPVCSACGHRVWWMSDPQIESVKAAAWQDGADHVYTGGFPDENPHRRKS